MKKVLVNQGDIYGKLTIIQELDIKISNCGLRYRVFKCKCECGTIKDVRLGDLRKKGSKATVSCGCYIKNKNRISNTTHGKSYSRIYNIWRGINDRCNNKNVYQYINYGGRGIMCDWGTFEDFYNDTKEGYKENLSIDRIDNNGNYCKENYRWVSMKEQCNNRRNNIYIKYNGKKKTIAQWSEKLGISHSTITGRYNKGLSVDKILSKNHFNPKTL